MPRTVDEYSFIEIKDFDYSHFVECGFNYYDIVNLKPKRLDVYVEKTLETIFPN